SEEVLNLLAQNPELTVIARTSSFSFSNEAATVPEIGRRLNVAHVLEGSVRRDGQRVRVTAQLVDTRSDAHLWSQTYDGSIGDVFGMQEDIARSVAGMLHAELLGEPPAALTHHPDPEAWPLYLRANHLYNRRGPDDMDHALALYREVTEIDPDFARAWAGVAAARSLQVFASGASLDQALPEMEHASQRALELAPDDVVVLLRAARTLRMKGAIDESWALAHRAQRQDPDHPLVLGMMVWWHMIHDPDRERILALQAQAATLDPLNAVTQFNYASGLLGTGQPEQAEAHFRLAKQISPTRREIDYHVALAALLQGRADEARAAAATLPEPLRWKLEAMAAHAQDDPAASARAMAALQGLPGTTNAVHVAEVHAFRGEPAGAVEWLDIARQRLDTHAPNETDLLLIASQGLLLHLAGGDPELGETLNRLHADLAADSRESAASDA
ncbi:MAG: hypothetical protein R3233_01780, partial [Xanthomonadales bacterium]|nr:hypothetical protein [Xanthomonadales bacterium]